MSKNGLCAIVTGSASGLGAATAAILARGGDARIVVNYSSSAKEAEQTADLCREAGAEVVVVQGDVSRDGDCRKIVAAAASWGLLDALINNAGITKHVAHGNLDGLSGDDFQRLYGVNTIGPFQMVRAARSLLEAGAEAAGMAAVVNVSSVAGINGAGSSIAYAASKGALNTMTAFAGPGTRAADPRQHRVPRLYRHALVHQGSRRRERGQDTRFGSRQGAAEARLHRNRRG
jgi:3-oxoacyl-[acyl-carrier protein] reductase